MNKDLHGGHQLTEPRQQENVIDLVNTADKKKCAV